MHHLVSSNVIWHNFTCLGCYSAMWDNCNIIWQHIKLWELQRQFSLFSLTWYGSHNLLEKSTDKYDIYAATVHMVAKFSKCLHRFGILWNRGSTKRSQKQSMDTQCQWAKLQQIHQILPELDSYLEPNTELMLSSSKPSSAVQGSLPLNNCFTPSTPPSSPSVWLNQIFAHTLVYSWCSSYGPSAWQGGTKDYMCLFYLLQTGTVTKMGQANLRMHFIVSTKWAICAWAWKFEMWGAMSQVWEP